MKSKRVVIILFLLLALIVMLLFVRRTQTEAKSRMAAGKELPIAETHDPVVTPTSEVVTDEHPVSIAERINRLREDPRWDWKRSIRFFGKVLDENNQPVEGATANFNWSDAEGEGKQKSAITDQNGRFSLTGEQGKRLQVRIEHPRFYSSTNNPISFEYADSSDRHFHRPNSEMPVIFHLKRKGRAEPLVRTEKAFRIAKNGAPVNVDLLQGQVVAAQSHLKVECWTFDTEKDSDKRYDWKCIVSVPSGGLIEATNEFDFVAPAEGYSAIDVIEMPKSLGRDWRSHVVKNYFLKMGTGLYGRMRFSMTAGGDHFFRIESFVHPSGSRNLEYDPAAQPKQTFFE